MTPEQRLRFIQAVERLGYTVDAYEYRGMMLVGIRDSRGYVARTKHPARFDWEEIARQFWRFQEEGQGILQAA